MTQTPRIRVAKPGKSIFSSDVRDFRFDERYAMFKYHSTTNTSVTLNAGDTEASATVSHALGYTPAFIAYYKRSDESVWRILPDIPYGVGFDVYPWAYATTTGVTVGYTSATPYRQFDTIVSDGYTNWGTNAVIAAGQYDGGSWDCGYRFGSVAVAKNAGIASATIEFRIDTKQGSGDVSIKTWGIDEDNVGSFGSDLGKSKTTAETSQNVAAGSGSYVGINVKSIVEEITTRSGWSYNNAMGFYTFNNGTPNGRYISDGLGMGDDTFLRIALSGSLTVSFRVIIFKDKID